ncbi:MAG: PEP-CTERM sorting domain-containing protein [Verrucomicrobia bacterium]|nr:PEP-CTERM sorting domain-containing protein [Verrucomicrobiota bacterium]
MNCAPTDGKPARPRRGAWVRIPCRTDVHVRLTTGLEARSTSHVSALAHALVIALLLAGSLASSFAESSFTGLGTNSWAKSVSANGKGVVGWVEAGGEIQTGGPDHAFCWSGADGVVSVGPMAGKENTCSPLSVSGDGSAVTGVSYSESGIQVFRWTATGGMVSLGKLCGEGLQIVTNDASSDGKVVVGTVGRSDSSPHTQPFRWTAAGGMVLGCPPGGFDSCASAVSSDGKVIVGWRWPVAGVAAIRWTVRGGIVGLGHLPGKCDRSRACAVSSDGRVIVGDSNSASGSEAFRWTAKTGMVGLGFLPGEGKDSCAFAVSSDGSVVLGESSSISETAGLMYFSTGGWRLGQWRSGSGTEAFVWDSRNGMRRLHSVLTKDYNLDLTAWTLIKATGISIDRKTIIGNGIHKDHLEAWVAHLDRPVNEAAGKGKRK